MTSLEERVARHIAATDWGENADDDAWWNSRLAKFREDYLAYAQQIIAIVRADDAEPQP